MPMNKRKEKYNKLSHPLTLLAPKYPNSTAVSLTPTIGAASSSISHARRWYGICGARFPFPPPLPVPLPRCWRKSLFSREVGLSSMARGDAATAGELGLLVVVDCWEEGRCGVGVRPEGWAVAVDGTESAMGPKRKRRRGSFWTWKGAGHFWRRRRVHCWRISSGTASRMEDATSRAWVWRVEGFCCCWC